MTNSGLMLFLADECMVGEMSWKMLQLSALAQGKHELFARYSCQQILWYTIRQCQPVLLASVKGFHLEPRLENAVKVGEELWKYFHPSGEGYTIRSFKRAWCVQATLYKTLESELDAAMTLSDGIWCPMLYIRSADVYHSLEHASAKAKASVNSFNHLKPVITSGMPMGCFNQIHGLLHWLKLIHGLLQPHVIHVFVDDLAAPGGPWGLPTKDYSSAFSTTATMGSWVIPWVPSEQRHGFGRWTACWAAWGNPWESQREVHSAQHNDAVQCTQRHSCT